jgi:feruloyl esterase
MKWQAPLAALAAAFLLVSANPATAQMSHDNCTALHNLQIDAAFVTSANVNPGGDGLPAFCQVRAVALPAISIEVRLPVEGWNGKLYQVGCGGFCGVLGRGDANKGFINAMGPGLARAYATATSDSGHHGLSVVDASWADHNPNAERDWGWRSIGETNRVAKALMTAFYADGPKLSYFQGCSTGGRMAHMASLRYPDLFQGIISGAPAMDYTGLVATSMAWIIQANTGANGEAILKPGKDSLIGDEVMRQCDGADGAEDGLIADPRACEVDLTAIQCKAGDAPEGCLSEAELGVVAKWRQGPVNAAGESLFPGSIPEGSEPFWWLWLTGKTEGGGKLIPLFGQSFMAYMAFADDPGAGYSPLAFDFETDPARLATMAAVYNSDDPDISKFRDAGGKMIVWHGWADAIVPPAKTVAWHEAMMEKMGGPEAAAETVRLFMIPGMDHCGLLEGPGGVNQFSIDPLTAIENWVENGTAPETIMK